MRELSRKVTKFNIKIENSLQQTVLLVIKSNPNAMQVMKAKFSASMSGGGISGERVRQVEVIATVQVPSSKDHVWMPPSTCYVSAFVKCTDGYGVLFLDVQADRGARYTIDVEDQMYRVKDIQTMEMVSDATEEELRRAEEIERIRLLERENANLANENESLNNVLNSELQRRYSLVEDSGEALMKANDDVPLVKILTLGDSGVGKTSLLRRYMGQEFMFNTATTVQPDLGYKIIQRGDGNELKLELWDTAGQTGLRQITRSCFNGLAGAIIAFDVTDECSFHSLEEWIALVRDVQPRAPIVIVGTKVDLVKERKISSQTAASFARHHGAPYYDTSSKEDTNVTASFLQVVARVPKDLYNLRGRGVVVDESNSNPKHNWWCCRFFFGG